MQFPPEWLFATITFFSVRAPARLLIAAPVEEEELPEKVQLVSATGPKTP